MATKAADSVFLDTNVLIFANVEEAPLHHRALEIIAQYRDAGATLWISGQVLREYLSVRSRAELFRKASSLDLLIDRVRVFESMFAVAFESQSTLDRLLMLLKNVKVGGKQIHDANIVATMLAHNVGCLLTDNTDDFIRFSSYIKIIPLKSR